MKATIATELFKGLMKAISLNGEMETPVLTFKPDHLETTNIDISHSVISVCQFGKDSFVEYDIHEEEEIAIDAEKTLKLIKNLHGEEVDIETRESSLTLVTETEKLKIPLLAVNRPKKQALVKIEENGNISVDIEIQLNETIPVLTKELGTLDETDTIFEVKDGKFSIMQETTDGYSFRSEVKEHVDSPNLESRFNTAFLKTLFNSCIDKEVSIRLAKQKPLVLDDKTENYQTVFMLAPMIEYK